MSNTAQPGAQPYDAALARLRLMYAKPEHPYYIMAPGYRETSSGIVSMHYLCHVLNLSGREAYIHASGAVNPELKTPALDAGVRERHRALGKVPIAVYPEVVSGNPLLAAVVARFMLNFEKFITGKDMQASPDDLMFYYAARLAEAQGFPDGDLLCLPTIDIELFAGGAPAVVREGSYLYHNRYPLERIDYTQLPEQVRLLSIANPLSLSELAEVLRKAEVLYTYEWSMTCVIAVLCGCPVIFMAGVGIDREFLDNSFFGCIGFAMSDETDALQRARASLGAALPRYVERTAPFWQQLDVFIDKTQRAARLEAAGNLLGILDWIRQRRPQPAQLQAIKQRLEQLGAPRIAVLVIDRGDQVALAATVDSLVHSRYQQLQIVVLGRGQPKQSNIEWLATDPQQPLAAINAWLSGSQSPWLMLVEAGTTFIHSGLLLTAVGLAEAASDCLAVYADEASRGDDGAVELCLRPDLNLDLLLSRPAELARHWLYRREALQQGFSCAAGRAFELELQLRLLSEHGLGCVAHASQTLLIAQVPGQVPCSDEQVVIGAHLQARGYVDARVLAQSHGGYRIEYGLQSPALVSIVIYLEGQLQQFQRCLDSLLTQTSYSDYQVLLIEPGTDDPARQAWLDQLEQIGAGRFEVLRFAPGQAPAAMCNAAAQEARGEYLLWLSACSVLLEPGWLQALLNHAQRPEVGAVGSKLLNRDGSIAQGGLVLGLAGSVGPAFAGVSAQAPGYMDRLCLDQNYSALGGECLMLRRALFIEMGGFDAAPLLSCWTAVDLCLKLQRSGYLNVWTPHARLLLDAEPVPAPSADQEDALYARWLPALARDPAYNRNLSLAAGKSFSLETNALSWRPVQHILPTVLACAAGPQPLGRARLLLPFMALRDCGELDGAVTAGMLSPVEIERFEPTSVIVQRPCDDAGLLALRRLRAFSAVFKVYDLDGYLPEMSLPGGFSAAELQQRLQHGISQADRVLVSTPALAQLLQAEHEDVRLLESALPSSWGRLQGGRGKGSKPRVGWLGDKDADLLAEVIPALAGAVEWVVLGDCPAALRGWLTAWHPQVDDSRLGQALAELDLDLALVPMRESFANACSGDLRILQHAACGQPVICSRVAGFVGGEVLPLTRVSNEAADWVRAIRLHLDDQQASAQLGAALQAQIRNDWLLEGDRLQAWRRAWLPD